ncbi:MAG TPA: hypothetical protein VFF52_30980 [Isosphaeraceae bacterium]|nr:hypothetical protein [Isosphaeraceae bacterium]
MSQAKSLADHLSPDSVNRLQRAAEQRVEDANWLMAQNRFLAALYFFGYSVEMVLSAAYFRSAGFSPNMPIDRDTRQRRMAKARQLMMTTGQPLMEGDPHPLVGWARFLEWQRSALRELTAREVQLVKEAIRNAGLVYKHWRPELRYKTTQVMPDQIQEVRRAAIWFIEHRDDLCGRE